ncbi:hypothetical protein NADFUDRAFT_77110 [Nadsonia fulvescens var. elongata DSM 6958]|uniref:Uncharacterized protein n=1 Tax=Nadsonia fulvescens var. elongata DSM 6958 TaxID=857566 RepID=A0A1E3PPC3_9ASCO|nr:hypothetical protein NADFUDRAFT_77110 [Nadsonia fulvescens var. elongata DSM 6958]
MGKRSVESPANSRLSQARSKTPYARPSTAQSNDENYNTLVPSTPNIFSLVKQYLTPTKWHFSSKPPFSSSPLSTTTSADLENNYSEHRSNNQKRARRNEFGSNRLYPKIDNISFSESTSLYPANNSHITPSLNPSSFMGKPSYFTPRPAVPFHGSPNQKLAAFFQQKGDAPLSEIEQAGVLALINEANKSGTSLLSDTPEQEVETSYDMDTSFTATPSRLPRKSLNKPAHQSPNVLREKQVSMSSPSNVRHLKEAGADIRFDNKPLTYIPTPYRPGSSGLSSSINMAPNSLVINDNDGLSPNQSFSIPEKKPLSKTASTLLSIIDPVEDNEPANKKIKSEAVIPDNLKSMVNPYVVKSAVPSKVTPYKRADLRDAKTPTKQKINFNTNNNYNASPPKNPLSDLEKTMPLEKKEESDGGSSSALKLSTSASTESTSPAAFFDKYKPAHSSKLRESTNEDSTKLGLIGSHSGIPEFKVSPEKFQTQKQDFETTDVSPSKPLYPSFSSLNKEKKLPTEAATPFAFSSLSVPTSSSFKISSTSTPAETASDSIKDKNNTLSTDAIDNKLADKPLSAASVFSFGKAATSPFKLEAMLELKPKPEAKTALAPPTFSFNFGANSTERKADSEVVAEPIALIESKESLAKTTTKPIFSFDSASTSSSVFTVASTAPVAIPAYSTSTPFTFGSTVEKSSPVKEINPVEKLRPVEEAKPVLSFSSPKVSSEMNSHSTSAKVDSSKYKDVFMFNVTYNDIIENIALPRVKIDEYKNSSFIF